VDNFGTDLFGRWDKDYWGAVVPVKCGNFLSLLEKYELIQKVVDSWGLLIIYIELDLKGIRRIVEFVAIQKFCKKIISNKD
jgi:hypothetical protein